MKEKLYNLLMEETAIKNIKLREDVHIDMSKSMEIALYNKAFEETFEDMKKIILGNFMI